MRVTSRANRPSAARAGRSWRQDPAPTLMLAEATVAQLATPGIPLPRRSVLAGRAVITAGRYERVFTNVKRDDMLLPSYCGGNRVAN